MKHQCGTQFWHAHVKLFRWWLDFSNLGSPAADVSNRMLETSPQLACLHLALTRNPIEAGRFVSQILGEGWETVDDPV